MKDGITHNNSYTTTYAQNDLKQVYEKRGYLLEVSGALDLPHWLHEGITN